MISLALAQNRYHQRVPRPRLTSMSALLGCVALPKDVAVSFFRQWMGGAIPRQEKVTRGRL
jgi:hypothetical protein